MTNKVSLNWPADLAPLHTFHQNQYDVPLTGSVECVTTTISTARNMMNELLSFRTGRTKLTVQSVQDYVKELDEKGWSSIVFRVPSFFPNISFPPGSKEKLNPRGFMLPRSQEIFALKKISDVFRQHYGAGFKVKQSDGNSLEGIAVNLLAGNLVLLSGMYAAQGKEQGFLGGSPHTYGPVTEINFDSHTITAIDTGVNAFNISSFYSFDEYWSKKSRLNLYTKPRTMTLLIPDAI